jgi:hypothetical protein
MPRARSIKPAFFKNELLAAIPPYGRLLFIGLWTLADREGRLEDRPARIKAELFPYEHDVSVEGLLDCLDAQGFIERYEVEGARYIEVTSFAKHQNPHHKEADSVIPGKDGARPVKAPAKARASRADSGLRTPDSGKGATRTQFVPPTVEEVRAYVTEKGYRIDPEAFVAFYASKGWKVGTTPMKSWQAACVTWSKRDGGSTKASQLSATLTSSEEILDMQRRAQEGK